MKMYIKPQIEVIEISNCKMLCSSGYESRESVRCDSRCKIYHICQDRRYGTTCYDKESKY